jgi:membrane-associated phospholipid phosphatase
MHLWQAASLIFFGYIVLVMVWRGPRDRAVRILAGSAIGAGIVLFSAFVKQPALLMDWIWPPLVFLVAYWSSGLLFVRPVAAQERWLFHIDEQLRFRRAAHRTPRILAEVLEAAYSGVYVIIPIALGLHLAFAPNPDTPGFWATVLITDFVCFAMLPWVQTRPPRTLESGEPWSSSLRRFNLTLLGSTSIQVNTFPSGHAAEALAAVLLVLDAPLEIVAFMFVAAIAVASGTVLGRYHYFADVVAGWFVAVCVWMVVS